MSLQLQNADDQKTFHFSALQLPLVIHGVAPSTTAVHSLRFSLHFSLGSFSELISFAVGKCGF